jgi:hypothetical protein
MTREQGTGNREQGEDRNIKTKVWYKYIKIAVSIWLLQIGKRLISLLQPITTIAEPFSKRLVGSGLMINLPS